MGVTSGAGTAYPSVAPEFTHDFQWGSCYSIFSFICMFCRSLFVLLYFFFGPLCCLFFFYIQILITPLVFSNSSYICFVEQSISMRIKQPRPVNLFNVGHDLQPKGKLSAQNLSPFQKHYKSCKHSTDVRSS